MVSKSLEEYSVLELKGLLFDLNEQIGEIQRQGQNIIGLIQKKQKEVIEPVKE